MSARVRAISVHDAPADLGKGAESWLAKMPAKMRRELAELGLI